MGYPKRPLFKKDNFSNYSIEKTTFHITERKDRLSKYHFGEKLEAFVVDTGHKNGYELHIIDSKGYIQVYNYKSEKFVTAMSGRPEQIKLYYRKLNLSMSDKIKRAIEIADYRNRTLNYNNI